MNTWEIKGHVLEYFDDTHTYLVDGIIVPSITQILKIKFKNKYSGVDQKVLNRASERGTEVHEAIEKLCKTGEAEDLKEVKNFIFLQKQYLSLTPGQNYLFFSLCLTKLCVLLV